MKANSKDNKKFPHLIDSTNYNATSTKKDIGALCEDALKNNFRAVCINLSWVNFASKKLKKTAKGRGIKISAIIDFPLGASCLENKIYQAKLAKKMGADEIDTVINLSHFLDGKHHLTEKEIKKINSILPTKFIIEHSVLSDKQVIELAKLLNKNNAFCLKLATGFIPSNQKTKIRHIKLIKKYFPSLKIKASGGIKTNKECLELLESGADIIGTSKAAEISKKTL